MPKRKWMFKLYDVDHYTEVRFSPLWGSGEIIVDDRVVEAWGVHLFLGDRRFSIEDKECIIRWPAPFSNKCDLFVDGQKIK